jgi:hypothetical protein
MDRREFLVGAAATAAAGPNPAVGANDLTEDSLLELLVEVKWSRGHHHLEAVHFVIPPEMRDMLKPGKWTVMANEAPRSSEDQPS